MSDYDFSKKQLEHFPFLEKNGGVVVGRNGRPIGLPAGSILDAFSVKRIDGVTFPKPGVWWK